MSEEKKKIGFLGTGTWGFCLASLLASNGHDLVVWGIEEKVIAELQRSGEHPKHKGYPIQGSVTFTTKLEEALEGKDVIVESVTSSGLRPVLTKVKTHGNLSCPLVLTSKGIEQKTGLLGSEVALEVFGEEVRSKLACISGPSHAEEVIRKLPSSVVCSSYDPELRKQIASLFNTATFRVYPNSDLHGVEFGGAMKNIIAIACGISDGLGFGDNTKAAIMTRGLHEIRKLSTTKGCNPETLNGLAGMGDLCVTCLSNFSRNYRFGALLSKSMSPDKAKEEIGQVVEGAYSCISALQLSEKANIDVPITQAVHRIIYEGMKPAEAVRLLLDRVVKEEHL